MNPGKKRRKAVVEERDCVACGCCVKVCPLGAIQVLHGITARVNPDKCVGCEKCVRECPASVIQLQEVEA
ncbi:ATP-binding protein [Subdoligranulum variabile]|uniref:4Fe-4S binding domain protein n=1 Tax=Subdoligranulum variabile DSM 15176 TaxID=411471 RepID=D1PJU2_9FIRM|nr:4Fe-4S binding protein [Subdoligranulum variabile]EFB77040.1 4Fe-4S binding domain protein [Subdoligranulum variabile DSM 15176]UWP67701.1 4Fe-4S binding protein [Subdoligranulum variabile]